MQLKFGTVESRGRVPKTCKQRGKHVQKKWRSRQQVIRVNDVKIG